MTNTNVVPLPEAAGTTKRARKAPLSLAQRATASEAAAAAEFRKARRLRAKAADKTALLAGRVWIAALATDPEFAALARRKLREARLSSAARIEIADLLTD